jgi:hypothetical protein
MPRHDRPDNPCTARLPAALCRFLADVGLITWGLIIGVGLLLAFVLWVDHL